MAKTDERELYKRAQRMLVGSLLAEGEATSSVLKLINEDDVEEPALGLVFSAVAELSRQNEGISPIAVSMVLEERGFLKEAGGVAELYSLYTEGQNSYLLDAPAEVYARIVKESSAKAKMARTLTEALPSFKDDSGVKALDAVTTIQNVLNERILSLSDSATISDFTEGFNEYLALLEERKRISKENEESEGLQGIPCLLPTMNKIIGGWKPGQMITVGAGTGVGKSVFAINCATAAAMANATTMIFSLEMSREQIEDRVIASSTGIPMNRLKTGSLSEDEMRTLKTQMEAMKAMNLVIDTEPNITIDGIRAKALKQAQSPAGLDFVVIDYLQLIKAEGRHGSRQEAVADISRNIKLLAKQLKVPIMALVQLNRSKDDDGETLPTLEKIRESHSIAQDSDIVILLHRKQSLEDTTPHTLAIIDKHRDGEKVVIRCHSNLACALFREVTRVKDVEERLSEDDENAHASDLDLDDFDVDLEEDLLEF